MRSGQTATSPRMRLRTLTDGWGLPAVPSMSNTSNPEAGLIPSPFLSM